MQLAQLDYQSLVNFRQEQEQAYAAFKQRGIKLNMARGKPSAKQLDLVNPLHDKLTQFKDESGDDIRNYGSLVGIPGLRRLFGQIMGLPAELVFVGGSSSLNFMHDCLSRAYVRGVLPGKQPLSQQGALKFLCPSPGYDRHFAVSEYFGIENIVVPMLPDGPDMDMVEALVAADSSIKGMWCVPQYSNPDGYTYSDETVRRIAALRPAADDFRIYWDNAYATHHFNLADKEIVANLYEECLKQGSEDMVYYFASSSKITMASAGVAAMGMSPANFEWTNKLMSIQTIGFDRVNQQRHLLFLQDMPTLEQHMEAEAEIVRPKFAAVIDALEREIAPLGIASWTNPKGGYFLSVYAPQNTAKRIVSLCKEAGLVLTGAGASYPYGIDPADSNIRIAPTFPPVEELVEAMELFCIALKLAAAEQLLAKA